MTNIKNRGCAIKNLNVNDVKQSSLFTYNSRRENTLEEIMAENTKEENFIFIFHKETKWVTCVCGTLIETNHTCSITKSTQTARLIYKECGYRKHQRDGCEVCTKKENFQKHLDSTYKDQDGYARCKTCDSHIHCCDCRAFVDIDGKEKCKKCKELWSSDRDIELGECKSCGFDGH